MLISLYRSRQQATHVSEKSIVHRKKLSEALIQRLEAGVSSYMSRVKRSIQARDHDIEQAGEQGLITNEIQKSGGGGKGDHRWNQFISVYSTEQLM